ALGVGYALELGLHLLEPVGLRLQGVEKPPKLEGRLVQPELAVAQLGGRAVELRRELRDRRERALGSSDEGARPVAFVGSERGDWTAGGLRELADAAEP